MVESGNGNNERPQLSSSYCFAKSINNTLNKEDRRLKFFY